MIAIVVSGFNWLFLLVGILGVIGIILLLPGVIIGAVLISKEKDEIKKKDKVKKGIFFCIIPFVLVIIGLIGTVIIQVVKTLLVK